MMQKIVKNEKHLLEMVKVKMITGWFENRENVELLLLGVKYSLKRSGHDDLALKLKTDPEELALENLCYIENYECCNDSCERCSNTENISDVLSVLEVVDEVRYVRWVQEDNRCYKDEVADTGKDVSELLNDVLTKCFKKHLYNIHRQYSELM